MITKDGVDIDALWRKARVARAEAEAAAERTRYAQIAQQSAEIRAHQAELHAARVQREHERQTA